MNKSLRNHIENPIILWLLFLLLLFFLIYDPAVGFTESTPAGILRSGLVKIDGKSRSAVFVTERRFRVTESTTISDVYGKNIELSDLPTPCMADIQYLLIMDQDPVTLRIKVKEEFPTSSTVYIPKK